MFKLMKVKKKVNNVINERFNVYLPPTIQIVMHKNRSTVSIQKGDQVARFHIDIRYGFLFWLRVYRAIKKVFKQLPC